MEKHEGFLYDNTEILRVRISLPHVAQSEQTNAFYEEMGEVAYRFCVECLEPYARAAYESDPDPRKHVRFRALRYRLWGEPRYQREGLLSVHIEATLVRNGDGRAAYRFFDAQNFSIPDGLLLSPHDALSLYTGERVTKRQLKSVKSLLLTEGAVFQKQNGAWEILPWPLQDKNKKKDKT